MEQEIKEKIGIYKKELSDELSRILTFWSENTVDEVNGGFYGRIDNDNQIIPGSPKGSVLNARILWTFSAAFNYDPAQAYLDKASRAYRYIVDHFIDKEHGGVYWSVNYHGDPLDTKKQVYAIAFTIYALSEYYRASGTETAKQHADFVFIAVVPTQENFH